MRLALVVVCAPIALLLSSCTTGLPVQHEDGKAESMSASPYSIVFVIHGDGDYLYHDSNGIEHRADDEVLAEATMVAQQNPEAEVFIFHQKPRTHFLFVFPVSDGEFYYYRNGHLVARESYRRDEGKSILDLEAQLYHQYRGRFGVEERSHSMNLFLYFGHEIPEFGGAGYDVSYPAREFTVDEFAGGLKRLTGDSTTFDLIVLSTCFNGTPYTIAALAPITRYILASPDNLHLSYFDLQPFWHLDARGPNEDVSAFATRLARNAFDRLTRDVQTAVTVALYDVERVQGYLYTVGGIYSQTLIALKEEPRESLEHCDCAENPAYVVPGMNEGVDVFFRPARFGRSKAKQSHSGWECWKERQSRAATSENLEPGTR